MLYLQPRKNGTYVNSIFSRSNPPWRGKVYSLPSEAPPFRGMPTRSKAFWSRWRLLAMAMRTDPPKKAFCHSRLVGGMYDKYRLPPSSWTWPFRTDTFTCSTNSLLFVYMVCLFNTLFPPTFFSSASSFWSLTGHNTGRGTKAVLFNPSLSRIIVSILFQTLVVPE